MAATPSFFRKATVFWPSIASLVIGNGLLVGAMHASGAALIEFIIGTCAFGIFAIASLVARGLSVADHDWSRFLPDGCQECGHLRGEVKELRQALATLALPESK